MIGPGWGFAVNTFSRDGDQSEIREMLRLGPAAEAAGFDSVWVGDHLLWHTPIVDATAVLGAFAATTERVAIGTAIYLLGLRQPVIAAKTIMSLGVLSQDRLVLGVGVGGENPAEFEAAGVPHERRGRLLDEALEALRSQWGPSPEPELTPRGAPIPILVGGRSGAARRRIERFGAGWIAAFVSDRRIREEVELLEAARGAPVPVALHAYVRAESHGDRARREAGAFLSHVYAMEEGPLMRYTVAGTPAECAEQLARFRDAGVTHFVLRPASWDQRAQLELWSESLLPPVRGG